MRTNKRELLIEKYIHPNETSKEGDRFWRNKYGELHNINDQPAAIYHEQGEVWWMEWWRNGVEYRKDGKPNNITYSYADHKNIIYAEWHRDGVEHRDGDKPASIYYNKNGQIEIEFWYENGELIKEKSY